MKRVLAILTALVMLSAGIFCTGLPALAGDAAVSAALATPATPVVPATLATPAVGEVLYHQDFEVLSDVGKSGIVRGTSSSEKSHITCTGETLELNTLDNDRLYALLPSSEAADSYTVEFEFSFSEIRKTNGYLGFILTCRGTEPTNVTALVIRADGTIDDFKEPDEALMKAVSGGETIHVKIPVEKDVLHRIEMTAGGKTYTLERESVKVLDDGGMGFVVRNASADVGEIYIVNGTGYAEKSGIYSKKSYAEDAEVLITDTLMKPAEVETVPETAPETGEMLVPYAAAAAAMAVGLFRRKKIFG